MGDMTKDATNEGGLSKNQIEDIEKIFEHMVHNNADFDLPEIAKEAQVKFEGEDISSYPPRVQESFGRLEKLIGRGLESEKAPEDIPSLEERILHAGLQYFLDPWDIIPDMIPEIGLLDDAHAIDFAYSHLKEMDENVAAGLGPTDLYHFAERGQNEAILTQFEVTTLRKLGEDWKRTEALSPKQVAFLEVMFEKLVNSYKFGSRCPRSDCHACLHIEQVLRD